MSVIHRFQMRSSSFEGDAVSAMWCLTCKEKVAEYNMVLWDAMERLMFESLDAQKERSKMKHIADKKGEKDES